MNENSNETDNSINYYIYSENYWIFRSFENVRCLVSILDMNENIKSTKGCEY